MIAAGMVTRPAIHPTPKSCRRRRYDGSTRAQDGRSRTRSSRNKTKTRLCPAATTTSNAGPATNHRFFSQRYKRIAHRARASGPRQTRRSPAHHVARPHVTTRARTGRQPSRSTKARQQVKRRWYASHSHNVHIDPAVHGGRSCCCFAAPSSSTPDAKFQRSRSRSACLPSSCSAHLFHRTTGSPNQVTNKDRYPKRNTNTFIRRTLPGSFTPKVRRVQPDWTTEIGSQGYRPHSCRTPHQLKPNYRETSLIQEPYQHHCK